jgi:flavin reductase (DIM6/NTAB) family NADH-FMN oxidoreductase RutF
MDLLMHPKAHQKDEFIAHDLLGSSQQYTFINSIIVPRPIAFITTRGTNGIINAAPYSYFNAVCMQPPIISISIEWRSGQRKDTAHNIFLTKNFVVNICSFDMANVVAQAGRDIPREVSEIELTELSLIASELVSAPRISNTPIQLECRFKTSFEIENKGDLILGEVVRVHMLKEILNDKGHVDFAKLNPLARLSGPTYGKITDFFDVPQ